MSNFIETPTSNVVIIVSDEDSVKDIEKVIQAFNTKVITTYNEYCDKEGSSTLVNQEVSESTDMINNHFFTTGVITYLIGGKDYRKYEREEYIEYELSNSRRLEFKFGSNHHSLNSSYVILPVDKCDEFRKEMEQIIQLAQSTGYFKPLEPLDVLRMVQEINVQVINTSKTHYPEDKYEDTGFCSLIERDKAPNANTIYMLDSNGKIEYTKGGNAFGSRSYFTDSNGDGLSIKSRIRFKFSDKMIDLVGNSYVILTQEECHKFRQKMRCLVSLIENSK
jgi:hypothetical protein